MRYLLIILLLAGCTKSEPEETECRCRMIPKATVNAPEYIAPCSLIEAGNYDKFTYTPICSEYQIVR